MNIEIENLTMTYPGGKTALKQLNISLEPGIYGLLGANGAGKSTLMNILTCNLKQTGGDVYYDGKNIEENLIDYVGHIGYVPQHQSFYKEMTAVQFLSYMANLKGLSKKQAKEQIPKLLQRVNLEEVGRKRLGTYSGGMKQRILIAQAMLGNPSLLILDEPTAGLDPKERIRIRNLISELSFDKIVMIATHVVTDVEFISKEILILKQGELIRQGTTGQLLEELSGHVFELETSIECYGQLDNSLMTSNVRRKDDRVFLRVVGDRESIDEKINIEYTLNEIKPELDDLYLYLFEE